MNEPLDLPIPLLRRLHEISDRLGRELYAPGISATETVGLILSRKLVNGGYWCTPKNTLKFANTGGDGVHFSLIQRKGTVSADSPVVMTIPASCGNKQEPNVIVGSSLINFIRFGLIRGFYVMEQVLYERDKTLKVYASAEWQPTEPEDCEMFEMEEPQQKILQSLASELDITPLAYTTEEFEALQQQYKSLLEFD